MVGMSIGAKHLMPNKDRYKYIANKKKEMRASGICTTCFCNKSIEGRATCESCHAKS